MRRKESILDESGRDKDAYLPQEDHFRDATKMIGRSMTTGSPSPAIFKKTLKAALAEVWK